MSQPQPNTEHIKFRIGISGTYWDKKPQYSILLNDHLICQDYIKSTDVEYIEFDIDIDLNQLHNLKIRLENKDWTDTVQNEDKTEILKDMVLHIKSVEVDEIHLGEIMRNQAIFTGDDPERPVLDNCVDLGWNGAWTLKFNSPFYHWIIDNL